MYKYKEKVVIELICSSFMKPTAKVRKSLGEEHCHAKVPRPYQFKQYINKYMMPHLLLL